MFHCPPGCPEGAAPPELVPHLPVLTWIEAHIYAIDDANEDSLRPGACRI
jgi:hypothetical protein